MLLIIGGPGGIRGTAAQTNPLFPWVYLAMLVGPSVAGILRDAPDARCGDGRPDDTTTNDRLFD